LDLNAIECEGVDWVQVKMAAFCDAVSCGLRRRLMFQRCILPLSSGQPWWWTQ